MNVLADETKLAAMVNDLAAEVKQDLFPDGPWAIVGIRSRGDVLAKRLADKLKPDHAGSVDITLYRDDLSEIGPQPVVRTTEIDFPVDGTNILLVDDVLMTGRSVRAAIQSLIDFGRPRCIKLLVLCDRGGRELPVQPDYVALVLDEADQQQVEVRLQPTDPEDCIVIFPDTAKSTSKE